jgi:N-acetylglucosamine-6-phosphate deacetylase
MDLEMALENSTTFYSCDLCISAQHITGSFDVDNSTGKIIQLHADGTPRRTHSRLLVDLEGRMVAPGFLELQTNGLLGFHFTHFEEREKYQRELERVAKYFLSKGVTGFWATVPTVSKDDFQKVEIILLVCHNPVLWGEAPSLPFML